MRSDTDLHMNRSASMDNAIDRHVQQQRWMESNERRNHVSLQVAWRIMQLACGGGRIALRPSLFVFLWIWNSGCNVVGMPRGFAM